MVKNAQKLAAFEKKLQSRQLPLKLKLHILNQLHREALAVGALPPKKPLAGFEVKLKLAKALNRVTSKPS